MRYKYLIITILRSWLFLSLSFVCISQETIKNPKEAPKIVVAPPRLVERSADETSKINPTLDEKAPFAVYIPKDLENSFVELNKGHA